MKKEKQSFTLIEILVVIVIIGILSSFIFFTINDSVEKAQIAKSKMFAESIRNNLLLNLVSEWKLDETSGTIFYDSWGGNDGTNHGADLETDCISGGCLNFNSTNGDYIDCGYDNSLNIKSNITINSWVKWSGTIGTGGYAIVGKAGGEYLQIQKNNGINPKIAIWFPPPINIWEESNTNVPSGNWHNIVVVYNNSNIKFYLNGNMDGSPVVTGTINGQADKPFLIGNVETTSRFFNGSIDEVQLYNAVISGTQIKQNYLAGLNNLYIKGLISEIEYNNRLGLINIE